MSGSYWNKKLIVQKQINTILMDTEMAKIEAITAITKIKNHAVQTMESISTVINVKQKLKYLLQILYYDNFIIDVHIQAPGSIYKELGE